MKPPVRLCWLLFALLVVCAVFIPKLRAESPTYVICDKGICVISEAAFDALLSLAKKAGKDCT